MTLDNMTGITEGSYTGFCKSQLITCNFVKACNGVCPFEDALKHADKTQTINDQHTVDHDRDWIIGCIEHDGFIHTHRFDKANQIILDALSAEAVQGWIPCSERVPSDDGCYLVCMAWKYDNMEVLKWADGWNCFRCPDGKVSRESEIDGADVIAWRPLPTAYKGGAE